MRRRSTGSRAARRDYRTLPTSVFKKSSPTKSRRQECSIATSYAKQSPKFKPAGCKPHPNAHKLSQCAARTKAPRKGFLPRSGIRLALGELLPGDAADQPGVAGELLVHPLEHIPSPSPLGAPAALERPTVDAGSHQADNSRLHANPLEFRNFMLGGPSLSIMLLLTFFNQPRDFRSTQPCNPAYYSVITCCCEAVSSITLSAASHRARRDIRAAPGKR